MKLDVENDEAWMEIMLGHGDIMPGHATFADVTPEAWHKAREVRLKSLVWGCNAW